ncbi:hypothetical protein [Paraburkholderia bannensis]|uniref:hypothetical protein n=1 Tax=Paraburkholderia bannensis TaxID=765414 RepID=UPI002AB17617|nr:hypothetical protein [Paraburkholderia bannensis]
MQIVDIDSPHPLLDLSWIRQACGDASLSVAECLEQQEKVGPNVLFDTAFYRKSYAAEIPVGMSCLEHFCRQRKDSPRDPNPLFSTKQWHETHGWRIANPDAWRTEFFRTLGQEARFSRQERRRYEEGQIVVQDNIIGSAPAPGQEICLFVHFDKADQVQPYVLDYLDALKERGFSIVFLTNSARLQAHAMQALSSRVWRVVTTTNRAYDWGLYFIGVRSIRDAYPDSPILMANDSVVYTGHGLDDLLACARADASNITGAIESLLHDWHLQSFFIYCGARVVQSDAWTGFWDAYRHHNDKWCVINGQEMGFSRWMSRHGVPMVAGWRYSDILQAADCYSASEWRNDLVRNRGITNPTVELWDVLYKTDFPFIKRSIFTQPISANNLDQMCNVISGLRKPHNIEYI